MKDHNPPHPVDQLLFQLLAGPLLVRLAVLTPSGDSSY